MTHTRENLYPVWADLSARADAARKAYRESDGGYTAWATFCGAMSRLGYSPSAIEHELNENNPNPKGGPGS